MGSKAEYIKISGNGPNALDFHIAFYIGELSAKDPTANFQIISKDSGFDPLIEHLKARKIFAARSPDVSRILPVKPASPAKPPVEKIEIVLSNLIKLGASKPRTLKAISSAINSFFQNKLSDAEIASLLKTLQTKRKVLIDGSKVTYALPTSLPAGTARPANNEIRASQQPLFL